MNVHRLAAALGIIALLALCIAAATDAPQEGRWQKLPETAVRSMDAQLIEQLESIGYLRGTREEARTGISVHFPAKAHQGLNLYTSAHAPEAILMDMEGRPLHTWRFPYQDAFGQPKQRAFGQPKRAKSNAQWWRRIHLFPIVLRYLPLPIFRPRAP